MTTESGPQPDAHVDLTVKLEYRLVKKVTLLGSPVEASSRCRSEAAVGPVM